MAELTQSLQKQHYLYGTDADPRTWRKRNRGGVAEYEGNEIDYEHLLHWGRNQVLTSYSHSNWSEYVIITEEEFNTLNQ
jgi:hypothetical protein